MEDIGTEITSTTTADHHLHKVALQSKQNNIHQGTNNKINSKQQKQQHYQQQQQQQQQQTLQHQSSNLRDINLTCGFCKKILFKPRLLNCLHTFCEDCLKNNIFFTRKQTFTEDEEVIEEGNIKCLVCFEFTKLPTENNVCMLPYNFFANNAMDYLMIQCQEENAILCTGCTDNSEAISRCVECSEFLCIQCISAHRRIRVTKDHKITPLDSLRYDKSAIHRPVFCPEHESELFTYYCEACEDLICKECTILQHKGHRYERLSDALEAKKPFITQLIEKNEIEKIPPINKAVDEVQDMAARLHARTIATKQAVRKCTEKCIRIIENRCDELLSTIDDLYSAKSFTLEQQQKSLQLMLMKNKSACQFVNYAFQRGSEAEIFELLDLMSSRLTKLNLQELNYREPDENDVIDHQYDVEAVDRIAENLGEITTSSIFLSHTKLYGPGLSTGKVEIETFFIIEVFDRQKQTCSDNFSSDIVRVKVQAPEGFSVNNKITNNKDGTFTVKYTPVTKGRHDVTVKIRGKSFPNSQFNVRVYEGIDYINLKGSFLRFGNRGIKQGEFKNPWSVAINQQSGHSFITDRGNNRIQEFDKFGAFVNAFGTKGTKDGQFCGPEGIAIDQSGIIFIADSENHRVQLFDPNGVFIGKFGSKGSKEGQLLHPSGVTIDRNGCVAVCDRDNHRVQLFSSDGEVKLLFGSHGHRYGQLSCPTYITVGENNSYLVCDVGNHRIACFDQKGMFSREIGGEGDDPGEFESPSGITRDHEGYIIVGDFTKNCVQVFTPDYKYFTQFGVNGTDDAEFNGISDIDVTTDGSVVVVDKRNNRIQVF